MTKLEAELIKAALFWHAIKVFKRYPQEKEDKALRRAAINLLTKQNDKATVMRIERALAQK